MQPKRRLSRPIISFETRERLRRCDNRLSTYDRVTDVYRPLRNLKNGISWPLAVSITITQVLVNIVDASPTVTANDHTTHGNPIRLQCYIGDGVCTNLHKIVDVRTQRSVTILNIVGKHKNKINYNTKKINEYW